LTLFICEFVFPALFALLAFGSGLLLERLTGRPLPMVLLLPLGLAVMVVVSQLTTQWSFSARLTPWVLLAVALAGWAVGWRTVRRTPFRPWPFAAAIGVYLTTIAPVLFSGQATVSAYGLDTSEAFHLAGIDWMLHHGRDFASLGGPSYTTLIVKGYFSVAYPTGAHGVIGGVAGLTGQDYAWIFQPSLAVMMAALALTLYWLARTFVPARWAAAAIAFVAAQPALVYAYELQGSLKEVLMLPMLALLPALALQFRDWQGSGVRRVLPLAVVGAAGVAADGPAYVAWFAPVIVFLYALALYRRPRLPGRRVAIELGLLVAVGLVFSIPTLVHLKSYFQLSSGVLSTQSEGGNLLQPLHLRQLLGVWLSPDHRVNPSSLATETSILIGVAALAVVLGVIALVRRAAWGLLLFAALSVIAAVYLTTKGSPWADAKVYVILSPLVVLLAMFGAAGLAQRGMLLEGLILGAVVALGVLWSDAVLYHDTTLAPRDRFAELKTIDHKFKGQGPTLNPDFEDFALYFLRDMDIDGPGNAYKVRAAILTNGQPAGYGHSYDLDELKPDYVNQFRTIVMRRSPAASRPPASFDRVFAGRFYEVWQRRAGLPRVVIHDGIQTDAQAGAPPKCADVGGLAATAAPGDQLAAVERPPVVVQAAATTRHSGNFKRGPSGTLFMKGRGELDATIDVPAGGPYDVWLQASVGRRLTVQIDGRAVTSAAYQANEPEQYAHAGSVSLTAGSHQLRIVRAGGDLHPGNGAVNELGLIKFSSPASTARQVTMLPPPSWRQLCGKRLDWVELVRPNP
jgi:hypothetical protein